MVQPAVFSAQDNRTNMGLQVSWASASLDSPLQFTFWLERFLMAVTMKENFNPEIMLEDQKDIREKPPPRLETPRNGEDANPKAARYLRDISTRDRVVLENEERSARAPGVVNNIYYNEVQKKLVSRLFLSLKTEGKKRFL